MDLSFWLFVPGVVGGVLIAIFLWLRPGRRGSLVRPDVFADRTSTGGTDVINVSAIRVAGVGGLGLVGMAIALAWTFPRIGQTVILGAVLGTGLAVYLVWQRRREGPLSTSSGRLGASTILSIDQPRETTPPSLRNHRRQELERARVAGACQPLHRFAAGAGRVR
jgi:hypothetical protein